VGGFIEGDKGITFWSSFNVGVRRKRNSLSVYFREGNRRNLSFAASVELKLDTYPFTCQSLGHLFLLSPFLGLLCQILKQFGVWYFLFAATRVHFHPSLFQSSGNSFSSCSEKRSYRFC